MLRGTNSLLRSSPRSISTLRAPVTQSAFARRLANPKTSLPRLEAPRQRLLPTIWTAEFSAKRPPLQPKGIDKEHEREVAHQKIEPHPERVSSTSTVRQAFEDDDNPKASQNARDVSSSMESEIHNVVETFTLSAVPRATLRLGLAGTLPYFATSLSTMYLSWNLNTTWPTSSNFLNSFTFSHETAAQWLQLLEPIQLGYGAVIISFLGAIHWGLELGEKAASRPRTSFRYAVGVLAPAVAWPTLLFPSVEWALMGQFSAFVALYFADARASARGWAPPWYGTYRFALTFIVGSAIFVSLIGRARIGEKGRDLSTDRLKHAMDKTTRGEVPYSEWAKREEADKKKEAERKKEEERKRKEQEKKKTKGDGEKKDESEKEEGEVKGDDKASEKAN